MLDNRYDLNPVMAAYPADCQPIDRAEPVLTGGFSGSQVWRLRAERGFLCLRRWPTEHPDHARLQWIHGVLRGVWQAGVVAIPVPIETITGQSFIFYGKHFWELSPWLPGEPDEGQPPGSLAAIPRIEAALTALADFHRAAIVDPANTVPAAAAPGFLNRLAKLIALESGGLDSISTAVADRHQLWPDLANRSFPLIESFWRAAPRVAESIRRAIEFKVPIQPCIRDIHRQHVLFQENRVTGIIDFGAMQHDNVACDIARLLGSMAQDDQADWQLGLAAYRKVRPLSHEEIQLVNAYDESAVLLSGINWLQWVFVEGRTFSDSQGVLRRFDQIAARLSALSNRSGGIVV